ncbi:MAG: sulfoxide reductase heme-binding subunit YedZ [Gammaproteobacteria bacterium]|nr:sulfoxide reductase heme-binding subunit YedZ [Gammaproteobacteria bacterium]
MTASLGADPQKTLVHTTGAWALRFLLITLSITPLRRLSGWSWPQSLRRMVGLYAFFYACLHFLSYTSLYIGFDWQNLLEDLGERPYITLGFLAWLGLLPLALSSTKAAMRKLGRRWGRLHKLVYPIAILGCWHYWWQVKSDLNQPLLYSLILASLLLPRMFWAWRSRRRVPRRVGKLPELSVN